MRIFSASNIIKTCLLVAGLTLSSAVQTHAQIHTDTAAPFFTLLPDIPLIPGTEELVDESIVFDKPAGRYVRVVSMSDTHNDGQILHFYKTALPALGWTPKSKNTYTRGQDFLSISTEETENIRIIYVTVEPQ
jgi:FlaG/FlaF family flagellin (archaellin)